MAITSSISADSATFSRELLEEAKTYNGRRFELRKLVDEGQKPAELLDAHTQVMFNTRNIMKGILFKVTLDDKKVYLLGTCHGRIIDREKDLPDDEEGISRFACDLVHPFVMEILNKSDLYVEIDMKNPLNFYQLRAACFLQNLIISAPLPTLARTDFIEATAMKICALGLDDALLEHKYRDGQKVISLETVEDQLSHLKAQVNLQRKDPKNFYFSSEITLEAIDSVQWGNIDTLEELDKIMPPELQDTQYQRNVSMADGIFLELAMDEKGIFGEGRGLFAVGATHLAGEGGIVSLLKKRPNVKVEQIIF